AGVKTLDDPQRRGRAFGVRGNHRVAVHRGTRERRHVDRRHDVLGGDTPAGGGNRHAFGPRDRRRRGVEPPPRFVKRNRRGEWTHYRVASRTRCPNSGTRSFSSARRTAASDPGSETTMRPAIVPATARLIIAAGPISS